MLNPIREPVRSAQPVGKHADRRRTGAAVLQRFPRGSCSSMARGGATVELADAALCQAGLHRLQRLAAMPRCPSGATASATAAHILNPNSPAHRRATRHPRERLVAAKFADRYRPSLRLNRSAASRAALLPSDQGLRRAGRQGCARLVCSPSGVERGERAAVKRDQYPLTPGSRAREDRVGMGNAGRLGRFFNEAAAPKARSN